MAAPTLADVDTAIAALVASPEVDYKVGDKQFKNSQKLQQLKAIREMILNNPSSPDIDFMAFDALDIDVFGDDRTQVVP